MHNTSPHGGTYQVWRFRNFGRCFDVQIRGLLNNSDFVVYINVRVIGFAH